MQDDSSNSQIFITMFGEFSIRSDGKEIRETLARTHQLWRLIEYLIFFRHQTVTQEQLVRILWPEGEIDNPANALKNLVYRARETLRACGFARAKEMILYSDGSYRWNNALPCTVDTEQFARAHKQALEDNPADPEEKARLLREAVALYNGDFLPGAHSKIWVAPIASDFRARYFQCVYALLNFLLDNQRYTDMEPICEKAASIDPFEEPIHRHLILALTCQGKQRQAMNHYSSVTNLFFRELGASLSPTMRALYREIIKTTNGVEMDLGVIKEDLQELNSVEGAFFCEYEVFKNMYRLEARTAQRTGKSIFITLVSLESAAEINHLEVKRLDKAMGSLHNLIQNNLRRGDVFARFSASQYILMIPALSPENCCMIMDRISKSFYHLYRYKGVCLDVKVEPIDPVTY